jgi:hypothetical protein
MSKSLDPNEQCMSLAEIWTLPSPHSAASVPPLISMYFRLRYTVSKAKLIDSFCINRGKCGNYVHGFTIFLS